MRASDLAEIRSLKFAISELNGLIETKLQKYSWRDIAIHHEMRIVAIMKLRNDCPGVSVAEAKEAVENFMKSIPNIE